MTRLRAVPIVGLLALAACVDTSVEPLAKLEVFGGGQEFAVKADGAGTYLIQFKNGRIPADFATSVEAQGGKLLLAHDATGIAIVGEVGATAATAVFKHKEIESVDADAYTVLGDRQLKSKRPAPDPAGAFFLPLQWNMPAISAPVAWAANKRGLPHVYVGIVDTGIDYLHPEFTEILDLERSRSFVEDPRTVAAKVKPIADFDHHGTLVASIVASNANFTAGVTSNVRLVSLKVCPPDVCLLSATLAAVLYAADNGLHVVNVSLGGELLRKDAKIAPGVNLIRIIEKVFKYAHSRGATVVVAAGNDARNMDRNRGTYHLYCDVPTVICVSATAPTAATFVDPFPEPVSPFYTDIEDIDAPAFYTNFGRKVTVAAPGGSIHIDPQGNVTFPLIWGACSGFVCAFGRQGEIAGNLGTSFAAPHVTGLAALLAGGIGHKPGRISRIIRQTADDRGPRGRDAFYGHGRINVAEALDQARHRGGKDNDRDSDSDN